MSTGYDRFTNQGCDVEDGPHDEHCNEKASEPAPVGYPAQQPPHYAPQQPGSYAYQPQVMQQPCQQTMIHVAAGPMPKDYFGFALFVTICCCLPFGIVGLVKSSEVKTRATMGDYNGANLSSDQAKRWSWAGCIIGGVSWGIALVLTCVYIGIIVSACNHGNCDY